MPHRGASVSRPDNMYWSIFGALLGCGRRLSLPSLLARLFPSGAQSPALSLAPAARPRPCDCRFLFGRGSGGIAALPLPHNAITARPLQSRRAPDLSSVERRGCAASRSIRSRVNKKKVRTAGAAKYGRSKKISSALGVHNLRRYASLP